MPISIGVILIFSILHGYIMWRSTPSIRITEHGLLYTWNQHRDNETRLQKYRYNIETAKLVAWDRRKFDPSLWADRTMYALVHDFENRQTRGTEFLNKLRTNNANPHQS